MARPKRPPKKGPAAVRREIDVREDDEEGSECEDCSEKDEDEDDDCSEDDDSQNENRAHEPVAVVMAVPVGAPPTRRTPRTGMFDRFLLGLAPRSSSSDEDDSDEDDDDDSDRSFRYHVVQGPKKVYHAVWNLALLRFFLFSNLTYIYWNDLTRQPSGWNGSDQWKWRSSQNWFTYDQFQWFYNCPPIAWLLQPLWGDIIVEEPADPHYYHMSNIHSCVVTAFGIMAAFGGAGARLTPYQCFGWIFLFGFACRWLSTVNFYDDVIYLYVLMAVLTLVAGGGSFFFPCHNVGGTEDRRVVTFTEKSKSITNKATKQTAIAEDEILDQEKFVQHSQWAVINLRIQFFLYLAFQTWWKCHSEFLQGHYLFHHFKHNFPWSDDEFLREGPTGYARVARIVFSWNVAMFLVVGLQWHRNMPDHARLPSAIYVYSRGFLVWSWVDKGHSILCVCIMFLLNEPIDDYATIDDLGGTGTRAFFVELANQLLGIDVNDCDDDTDDSSKSSDSSDTTDDAHVNRNDASTTTSNDTERATIQKKSNDTTIFSWIVRLISGKNCFGFTVRQRLFSLCWLACQLGISLRDGVIDSTWLSSGRGIRFSWRGLVRSNNAQLTFGGRHWLSREHPENGTVVRYHRFDFLYLLPTCNGRPRTRIQLGLAASDEDIWEDPRTLPLWENILNRHQMAALMEYPDYVSRIAGGWAAQQLEWSPFSCGLVYDNKTAAALPNLIPKLEVFGVLFAQRNGHGVFSRIVDPTVNLVAVDHARSQRSLFQFARDLVWHRPPHMFSTGIGTYPQERFAEHYQFIWDRYGPIGLSAVEYFADRSACLLARPLLLRPNGFGLAILPLSLPRGATLQARTRNQVEKEFVVAMDQPWELLLPPVTTNFTLGLPRRLRAISMELGLVMEKAPLVSCSDTTKEDVLFAILFIHGSVMMAS